MKQDEKWLCHYRQVLSYMAKNKRQPSKHREEDHRMLNWIKYNKKLVAQGKLPADRVKKFNHLLEKAAQWRRLNQYAYAPKPDSATELSLF